ncbi:putative zinc finger protein [Orchesella cincta]|uniref:Putative zinc finger protein n=1 Tax=Orchesella cincta TaxID=48709 RepID=A0A1D2NKP8_ORCCI|nr:putative zinc finger protein [Orchesella cincta]
MNRQRRIEAIARRRAIIDNHLQMLASSNEARIPNIIRSRTPKSQQVRPRYNHSLQLLRQFETVQVDSVSQQTFAAANNNGREEEFALNTPEEPQVQENGGLFSQQPVASNEDEGQVYMALVSDDNNTFNTGMDSFMGQNQDNELVPVPFELRDEVMKMLAASASNEQFANSLQTFKTEDGTVMVVLDGNDMYKQMESLVDAGSSNVENGYAEATVSPQPEVMVPEPIKTENTNEDVIMPSADGEQTYVIVQDAHGGHILIPSSAYRQANADEENIVELIAAEGAHIEQLMAKSNNSVVTKTVTSQIKKPQQLLKRPAASVTKVSSTSSLPKTKIVSRHIQQRLRNTSFTNSGSIGNSKSDIVSNGQRTSSTKVSQYSTVTSESKPTTPWPIVKEEKPRPFRFELPELEDSLDCNFLSVPVPIQIGNIRSITEKKGVSHEKKFVPPAVNSTKKIELEQSAKNVEDKMLETCEVCQAEFRCRKTLVDHIESVHQELRLFKCDQCDQQFSFESSLINHTRIHQQKKYQCGRCNKLFQAETTVLSHQKYCGSEILNSNDDDDATSSKLSDCDNEVTVLDSNTQVNENGMSESECINILESSENGTLCNFSVEVSTVDDSLADSTSHTHSLSDSNLVTSANHHIFQQEQDGSSDPDTNGQYCEDAYLDDEIEPPNKVAKLSVQNSECDDLKVLSVSSEVDVDIPTETYSYTIVPNPDCNENEDSPSNNGFHVVIIETPSVPETVGRRTLNKATAKANMSNEVFTGTWESHMSGDADFMDETEIANAQNCDLDGDLVTLRSAKIRARNIRIREMEGKEPNEEEISVNFLNIFQQVVKQSST